MPGGFSGKLLCKLHASFERELAPPNFGGDLQGAMIDQDLWEWLAIYFPVLIQE